jgi:hypothetical protein
MPVSTCPQVPVSMLQGQVQQCEQTVLSGPGAGRVTLGPWGLTQQRGPLTHTTTQRGQAGPQHSLYFLTVWGTHTHTQREREH